MPVESSTGIGCFLLVEATAAVMKSARLFFPEGVITKPVTVDVHQISNTPNAPQGPICIRKSGVTTTNRSIELPTFLRSTPMRPQLTEGLNG